MKHNFVQWRSSSQINADLDAFRRTDQREFGLYNLRRALEKNVNRELRRDILSRYHDELIVAGSTDAALKLRSTALWKEEFSREAASIDRTEIQFIGAQFEQLCQKVGELAREAPFDFARSIIGLKRRHPQALESIGYAVRAAIGSSPPKDRRDEIALRLAIEDYREYGSSVGPEDLKYFFARAEHVVCNFFREHFETNIRIFVDFCLDLLQNPENFREMSDRAIFRVLALAYVYLDRDSFDRMLRRLDEFYPAPRGELSRAGLSTARVVEAFRANVKRPHARAKKQKLKIAFCVSGQMRGYAKAFESWKHLRLEGHHVKYFVHTWEDSGWRFPDPLSGNGVARVFKHSAFVKAYMRAGFLYGVENLKRSYPIFFSHLENVSSTVTESDVKAVYGPDAKVVIESHDVPAFANDDNNQIKMFYKIRAAHRLMEEDGDEFDLVVRLRPDRAFRPPRDGEAAPDWTRMAAECRREKLVFMGELSVSATVHARDQFAFGSSEAMRCYADTPVLQEAAAREAWFGFPKRLRAHVSLGNALFFQGVRCKPLQGIYSIDAVPTAAYGKNEIKRLLSLDLPSGPVTDMDRLLWNSLL